MFIADIIKNIPSLLREGMFTFIALAIMCASGCDSKGIILTDLMRLDEGKVLLALEQNKNIRLVLYNNDRLEEWGQNLAFDEMGSIKRITSVTQGLIAFITENNGIFLIPVTTGTSAGKAIAIPVDQESLVNKKIRDITYYQFNKIRKLYVIYDTPKGHGATELLLRGDWSVESCTTLDTNSSELRSNNIIQVEPDMMGNLWFVYSKKEEKGVSRLDKNGEWSHFDRNNSELPDKFVRYVRSEGPDDGITGNNVWFASRSGLTRMEYRPGEKDIDRREKWKLYGERETTGGIIARAIGIRDLLSDAVLDLIDLYVTDKYLLMANQKGVYIFNGRSVNRFKPDNTGGLNDTHISDINYRDGFIIVKTRPGDKQNQYVDSVSLLDIKKRKWTKVKLWDIKKDFPRNIYFIPYKKGIDLIAATYLNGKACFALYNYDNHSLTNIELPLPAKVQQETEDAPDQGENE